MMRQRAAGCTCGVCTTEVTSDTACVGVLQVWYDDEMQGKTGETPLAKDLRTRIERKRGIVLSL